VAWNIARQAPQFRAFCEMPVRAAEGCLARSERIFNKLLQFSAPL
jgi:hypothetical protein